MQAFFNANVVLLFPTLFGISYSITPYSSFLLHNSELFLMHTPISFILLEFLLYLSFPGFSFGNP